MYLLHSFNGETSCWFGGLKVAENLDMQNPGCGEKLERGAGGNLGLNSGASTESAMSVNSFAELLQAVAPDLMLPVLEQVFVSVSLLCVQSPKETGELCACCLNEKAGTGVKPPAFIWVLVVARLSLFNNSEMSQEDDATELSINFGPSF